MNHAGNTCRVRLAQVAHLFGIAVLAIGSAIAATPPVDEAELLKLGFKVLVATTDVQQKRVRELPPGKIRAMQRTGKKYFIYPDAAKDRIYVGGPAEYAAYTKALPLLESQWMNILRDRCTRTNSVLTRPNNLTYFTSKSFL